MSKHTKTVTKVATDALKNVTCAQGFHTETLFEGIVVDCARVEKGSNLFTRIANMILGKESGHILTLRNADNQLAVITVPDSLLGELTVIKLSKTLHVQDQKSVTGDVIMRAVKDKQIRLAQIPLLGSHRLLSFQGPGAGLIAQLAFAQGKNIGFEILSPARSLECGSHPQLPATALKI